MKYKLLAYAKLIFVICINLRCESIKECEDNNIVKECLLDFKKTNSKNIFINQDIYIVTNGYIDTTCNISITEQKVNYNNAPKVYDWTKPKFICVIQSLYKKNDEVYINILYKDIGLQILYSLKKEKKWIILKKDIANVKM